ncbi:MAG TPA: hypothetical protein VIV11_08085 [Kofleriaceae bacterium]
MRVALIAAVAACGPGLKRAEPKEAARTAIVEATQQPGGFENLLRGSVVNGGLWFEDSKCAAQFGLPGEIQEAKLTEFARCLATLKLQPSERDDALGDVVVLQYGLGFEIEARVVLENRGPRLSWIGWESRRDAADNSPTITAAALEALRTSGDRNGPLDPAVASALELDPTPGSHAAFTWIKVCLDETGALRDVFMHETTSLKASTAFVDAARTWTFKPFAIQGRHVPVCSMVRMAYPPGRAPSKETLPMPPPPSLSKKQTITFVEGSKHSLIEGRRIAGVKNIAPDDETKTEIQQSGLSRIIGKFRVCLGDTGRVESVLPMLSTGFAAYDRRIIGGIQAWAYSPYQVDGEPVPVCTAVTFIYSQL